jgi:hypothetical protein
MAQEKNNVTILNCGKPMSNPDDCIFSTQIFDAINNALQDLFLLLPVMIEIYKPVSLIGLYSRYYSGVLLISHYQ